jgi:tetratricopeptide (TPR) repeat protein
MTILQSNPFFSRQTSSGVSWIVTARVLGHWVPLTWASYALDAVIWGQRASGYHLTNVLIHTLNAVLVYCIARRLLARAAGTKLPVAIEAGAVAAALAFAVHPLRVESVAWVTERRDVLSGLGFLAAVFAYLRAVDARGPSERRRWMGLSLAAYAGSLLAKQITMTLPLVLVILDLYPLRRFDARRTLLEKAPFALLGVAGAAAAALGQARDIGFTSLGALGIGARLALVAHSLVYYPLQTVAPYALSPLHELPARLDPLAPRFVASLLIAAGLSVVAAVAARRAPWFAAAWAYSAVTILPVSGLAHVATIMAADRYSYLSMLSWALVLGGAVTVLLTSDARRTFVAAGAAAAMMLIGGWAFLAWSYLEAWREPERLWRHAVGVDAECAQCRGHLAVALLAAGQLEEAERAATLAVALRPDRADHHAFLASVLERRSRLDEAARSWAVATRLHPHYEAEARRALGAVFASRRRLDEAARELRAARALAPNPRMTLELVRALNELAAERARTGRLDEAERALLEALALRPDSPELRDNLAALRSVRLR